jgi:hypothetical protein
MLNIMPQNLWIENQVNSGDCSLYRHMNQKNTNSTNQLINLIDFLSFLSDSVSYPLDIQRIY